MESTPMNKSMRFAALFAFPLALAACSTGTIPLELAQRADTEELEVGMSIADTRELLGDNFETRHEEHERSWFYTTDAPNDGADTFVVRFDYRWKVKGWAWEGE